MKIVQKVVKPVMEKPYCDTCGSEMFLVRAYEERPTLKLVGANNQPPVVMYEYMCSKKGCGKKDSSKDQYPRVKFLDK